MHFLYVLHSAAITFSIRSYVSMDSVSKYLSTEESKSFDDFEIELRLNLFETVH